MNITRIPHYITKLMHLGPQQSFVVIKNRIHTKLAYHYWRQSARARRAHHTWPHLINTHHAPASFTSWWQQQRTQSLSFLSWLHTQQPTHELRVLLQAQADLFVHKTFDILGSGPITFTAIPWHEDFRLRAQHPHSDTSFPLHFYQDVAVSSGTTEKLIKDIKVPWELSRFQHLLVLGQAYEQTHDERYARAFVEQVNDWITNNPYLLGPNWVCPMDVGIRALNWVVAFHFFKTSPTITESFWQRFTCSLYDHLVYLENNWEIYDGRTSNHYLSDLVGYLYVCWFFKDLEGMQQKMSWCFQEIMRELDKQVLDDGSDYEGSTSYHKLVTELFYLAALMVKECNIPVSDSFEHNSFEQKLSRMFTFIDWCGDLQVGDNDSGKILYYGITPALVERMKQREPAFPQPASSTSVPAIKHFPTFGISVLKTPTWQASLRHHAYNSRQPSGHFHNDIASVTVSFNGIPLFVDPGSYVYTPSAVWRNSFRSVANHNTFFIEGVEPIALDGRLFALEVPERALVIEDEHVLQTSHTLYEEYGLTAHRRVTPRDNTLIITDEWRGPRQLVAAGWNFTLAPDITVEQQGDEWVLGRQGDAVAVLSSPDLIFTDEHGWYSAHYGEKKECRQLKARHAMSTESPVEIVLRGVV